ncbi:MAG: hypothetical protein JWM58_2536 [Rhizobium sp.]|nr:hypothetical protein [Rhizobium sp.]
MSIHDELQAVMTKMAAVYQVGDAAGCAALFTENAEVHSPYAPPAVGRRAIEELHREWTKEIIGEKSITVLQAAGTSDAAWCLAKYSEGTDVGNGTSLNVFERQPDGSWLIRMCSLNSTDTATT